MQDYYPNLQTVTLKTSFVPRWKVSLLKNENYQNGHNLSKDIYYSRGYRDNFLNTHYLEVERNFRTTDISHFQAS